MFFECSKIQHSAVFTHRCPTLTGQYSPSSLPGAGSPSVADSEDVDGHSMGRDITPSVHHSVQMTDVGGCKQHQKTVGNRQQRRVGQTAAEPIASCISKEWDKGRMRRMRATIGSNPGQLVMVNVIQGRTDSRGNKSTLRTHLLPATLHHPRMPPR